MHYRIAIVGAGFSGTVLAAHLLRHTAERNTDVVLIERGPAMGRGVAYAARDWPYLLNVPAGRLSADARDPLQFLRFAREVKPGAHAEEFLPRELYGDYLEDVLTRAEQRSSSQMRLTRVAGEVVRIAKDAGSGALELHMATGDSVVADTVVLAVGNPAPGSMPWASAVGNHAAYRKDPWTCSTGLDSDQTVLIMGSGLTMVDVALSLARNLERAPRVISISRHGLLPLQQSTFHAAAHGDQAAAALASASTTREVMGIVRGLARDAAASGGDWREIITSVRNLAPQLWRRLAQPERRRFLRHLRSYWDVHRHRIPAELAARLESIRRAGKLDVIAGRLLGIEPAGQRLRVTWRGRGTQSTRTVDADLVVNAMGPEMSPRRSSDRLLASLCEAGWIAEDDLALGLRVAPQGACIGRDGVASNQLFYLGPMLRAEYWEATAATELRDHAQRLATFLVTHRGE